MCSMGAGLFAHAKTRENAVEEVVGVDAPGEGRDAVRGLPEKGRGDDPARAGIVKKGQRLVAGGEACHKDFAVAGGNARAGGFRGGRGFEEKGVERIEDRRKGFGTERGDGEKAEG